MSLALWLPAWGPEPVMGVALMAVAILASLFPDVDTDSKGQRLFYAILVLADLTLMWFGKYRWAAILGFVAMLPAVGHHRGWTHTWWAMLVVPLPIVLLPAWFFGTAAVVLVPFYAAAVLGYLSHLILDRLF
nr:metal-dependent hydrolase [Desulfobaculum xiamenense]